MIPTSQLVETAMDNMFGNREAVTISRMRVEKILADLAHEVVVSARDGVLMSLQTVNDVAALYGITPQRVRAIAQRLRRSGHPIGWPVQGTSQWLFLPGEVGRLKPGPTGRPKKSG